jgi:hypothetical protein
MQKFMSSEDFGLAMFQAQTNYADISAFFGSDRRTGHRWQEDGPSNQVSRLMQLMCALSLTLDDVRLLIASGIAKSGTSVPDKVASVETQVAALRREATASKRVKGRAQAARGGKGASNDRRSKSRAPKARQPAPAAV